MKRMLSIRMICCLVLVIFSLQSLLPGMSARSAVSASEKKEMVWKQNKIFQIKKARQLIGETVTVSGIVTADQSAIGNGKLSTYIQDKSAGINVYSAQFNQFPELIAAVQVFPGAYRHIHRLRHPGHGFGIAGRHGILKPHRIQRL